MTTIHNYVATYSFTFNNDSLFLYLIYMIQSNEHMICTCRLNLIKSQDILVPLDTKSTPSL